MPSVLVVGASLGGLRAAEQLRAQGFDGALTIVGAEPHLPYNRPPLSKEALSGPHTDVASLVESLAFRRRASVDDAVWRLGTRVVSASLVAGTATLDDGEVLRFDGLVVATGLRPRRLPALDPRGGRHVVRTADDAARLRAEVRSGARAVVVGGGFIGCETASTLQSLGCEVTVVEPLPVPMVRGVGRDVGRSLLEHHRATGAGFVTGQGVADLVGDDGRVSGVLLDDGSVLPADLVEESVGSHANVEWLEHNDLDLSDGLLCDNHLRVEGLPGVVAVGDVARFPNPRYDDVPRRVEHWSIPGDTAKRAAETLAAHLAGRDAPDAAFAPLPSFWSDQFGLRLQSFGAPGLADSTEVVEGSLGSLDEGAAVLYRRGGEIVGALLVNVPVSRHAEYRSLVLSAGQLV